MRPRVPWFVGFLARRLVWAVVTMLVFVAVLLVIMEVWVPYNWAVIHTRRPDDEAAMLEALGLDVPLPVRYAQFVLGLLRGDLGTSFGGASVTDIIAGALPVTLTVFLVGAVLGWIIGEVLGRIGSWNRSVVARSSLSTLAVASAAMFPPFLVFVLVTTLREPMLASRDAFGLPEDSLVLWRNAVMGEPNALMPSDVWWVVAGSSRVSWRAAAGIGSSRASPYQVRSPGRVWASGSAGSGPMPSTSCTARTRSSPRIGPTWRSPSAVDRRPWRLSAWLF